MTNEELVELIQAGINVKENMGLLFEQNYRLIRFLVRPYSRNFGEATKAATKVFEIEDLINNAYFNLHDAVKKYDSKHGVKFTSFASPFIKLGAKRFVEGISPIFIPTYKMNLIWRFNLFVKKHVQELNVYPTNEILQNEFKLSFVQLEELKQLSESYHPLSLDLTDDEDNGIADTIPGNDNVEHFVIQKITHENLKSIWNEVHETCSEKEQEILIKRYVDNKSLIDISKKKGLDDETIRQREISAFRKLRKNPKIVEMGKLLNLMKDIESIDSVLYFKSPEKIALKNIEIDRRFNELLKVYGLEHLLNKLVV